MRAMHFGQVSQRQWQIQSGRSRVKKRTKKNLCLLLTQQGAFPYSPVFPGPAASIEPDGAPQGKQCSRDVQPCTESTLPALQAGA